MLIQTGSPPANHPASRPIPTLIHYKLSDDPDTQRSSEKHYLYKRLKQALTVFTVTDAIARSREEGFKTSINSCADTWFGASSLAQPQILSSHSRCFSALIVSATKRHSL
ncbi:MAG: hypothetical protein HXM81_07820, partial [Neisseria sicca]|nr:hypothetical protein [Neisseria sicca]